MLNKEITDSLYKTLEKLGLSEHEQKLYVLSLSLGSQPVAKLAEHLGIPRPNVYKVIQALEKRGLAQFSEKQGYNRQFMVESPSKISELLRSHESELQTTDKNLTAILPDLLSAHRQGDLPTKVKILHKREDLLLAFEQIFDEALDEIKYLGSSRDLNAFVTHARLEKQIKKRFARGIKTKLLVFSDEDAKKLWERDAGELRETRFLEEFKPFVTGFYLFANKVIIWQPKAPLAVLIEDEYIVAMLSSIYQVLWKNGKQRDT